MLSFSTSDVLVNSCPLENLRGALEMSGGDGLRVEASRKELQESTWQARFG